MDIFLLFLGYFICYWGIAPVVNGNTFYQKVDFRQEGNFLECQEAAEEEGGEGGLVLGAVHGKGGKEEGQNSHREQQQTALVHGTDAVANLSLVKQIQHQARQTRA